MFAVESYDSALLLRGNSTITQQFVLSSQGLAQLRNS